MGEEATAERLRRIFVEDFIDVSLPLKTVRMRFARARLWVAGLANAAEEDGETLYLQIGPKWAHGRVTREVEVLLGPMRERGEATVVPLIWKATGLTSLFPVLDGDLELAPLGPNECRLTLTASYLPPFGHLGRTLDNALMHRVAQSTLRSFLARVGNNLQVSDDVSTASSA
jgi:hypothetical protein